MKKKFVYILIILILLIAIAIVGYYLFFDNDNRNDVVFLLFGSSEDSIYLNNNYNDMGYHARLKDGDDLSEYVTVSNNVDISRVGKYEIKYTLNYNGISKELIRYVNVLNDPVTDISLGLNGDNVIYLLKGMDYTEQGVNAYDVLDGNINSYVEISNSVDTQRVGEYIVSYQVTNSRNVTKSIERKVIIYDYSYVLDIAYNDDGNLQLNFMTDSDLFKELVIDSTHVSGKTINILLVDNKQYTVSIVDIYGNKRINTYDFLKPSLSCNATIATSGVTFNVTASNNAGIKEYIYYLGDNKYTSDQSVYRVSDISDEASVSVVSENNNMTTTKCRIINNVPYIDGGLKNSQYSNWLYYLYVPENIRQYEKVPLVIFLHGMGERGHNLELLKSYGFIKYINEGEKYNAFILVPQLNSNAEWRNDFSKVINLIETVKSAYNIDDDRVNIVGFSLGANDTIVGLQTYNNYFASAVLISTSGRGSSYARAFKNIPTQVYNGELDNDSHTSGTKDFVDELSRIGGDVAYVRYGGYGHNVVERVLADGTVLNWILEQKRSS